MVDTDTIDQQQKLLESIVPPLSDDEAVALLQVFGVDDYFGMAWTLLHLVESAPGWPIGGALDDISNEWIVRLRDRAARGNRKED
jgi:hypothetical protein